MDTAHEVAGIDVRGHGIPITAECKIRKKERDCTELRITEPQVVEINQDPYTTSFLASEHVACRTIKAIQMTNMHPEPYLLFSHLIC